MQNKNGKRRIKKSAKLQAISWMYQSLQDSNSRSHVIAECEIKNNSAAFWLNQIQVRL
jgi:hypothetical protein